MISGGSINSLLATNYSNLGQTAQIQQLRADEAAAKARLRAAEEAKLAQEVVLPISRDGRKNQQGGGFVNIDQREQQSLRDFAKPKAELSPSDEVTLFGALIESVTTATPEATSETIFEEGSDGVFYAVNDNKAAQTQTAATKPNVNIQQQVAELYQRNYKAQFNSQPAYTLAA